MTQRTQLIFVTAGTTCEEVVNPCGQYVDLSTTREQVVTSQSECLFCISYAMISKML